MEDTDAPTSASRTPPSEPYDSQSQGADPRRRSSDGGPAPRVSFSFPVPRVSLTRGAVASPMSNSKLRSCDVYIGFHGQGVPLSRFCRWLKAELELQGIDLDQESIMTKNRFLIEKLNTANVLVFPSTCDEKQQVEVYQRLSWYYIEVLKVSVFFVNLTLSFRTFNLEMKQQ